MGTSGGKGCHLNVSRGYYAMKLLKAVVALDLIDRYAVSILLAFCTLYNPLFVSNFVAIKVIVRDIYALSSPIYSL